MANRPSAGHDGRCRRTIHGRRGQPSVAIEAVEQTRDGQQVLGTRKHRLGKRSDNLVDDTADVSRTVDRDGVACVPTHDINDI